MGLETISYKGQTIEEHPIILSRLQKFIFTFLSPHSHPAWFKELLQDIDRNSITPVPKSFFEEEDINDDSEKEKYIVEMLDKCIDKMNGLSKREFIDSIRAEMQGTFYDISNHEDCDDNASYKQYYIGTLKKLRDIIAIQFTP